MIALIDDLASTQNTYELEQYANFIVDPAVDAFDITKLSIFTKKDLELASDLFVSYEAIEEDVNMRLTGMEDS